MSDLAKQNKAALFVIDSGMKDGKLQVGHKLPDGIISATSIIPTGVLDIIKTQFASVGLNFNISSLALNKDNRALVKQLRETVDLISNNSKLLPEIKKCVMQAMNASAKQAKFNASIARHALKTQLKIDEAQADIILAMMGYNKGRTKIQARLERKAKQQAKIESARARYYDTSWGREAQLIDAKWDMLTDVNLERMETKQQKASTQKERDIKNEKWLQDSY